MAKPSVVQRNKELEVKIFEEMYDKRNIDIIDEMMAEDWVDHATETFMPGMDSSRAGLKEMTLQSWRAFPDSKVTIDDMLADEDRVMVRFHVTGTHTGEDFMGIPATGKEIVTRIIVIDRWVDEKLVESWGVWDQLGVMQQMGMLNVDLPS